MSYKINKTVNKVTLLGEMANLSPNIKETRNGKPYTSFYVKTYSSYTNRDGEFLTWTESNIVSVFNPVLVKYVNENGKDGCTVLVEGARITTNPSDINDESKYRVSISVGAQGQVIIINESDTKKVNFDADPFDD